MTFYKAVRPNGTSFHDPSFSWAMEPGQVTAHPNPSSDVEGYLSVSTVPSDCTAFLWPCRLIEVEPVGEAWIPDIVALPNKRAGHAFRTVRELPAHKAFGPQGAHVVALLARASRLTESEMSALRAARDAARDAAWDAAWGVALDAAGAAAWDSARDAAWGAARGAAWGAARDAADALIVRDLISFDQYALLTGPWRAVIGPVHPDDSLLEGEKP